MIAGKRWSTERLMIGFAVAASTACTSETTTALRIGAVLPITGTLARMGAVERDAMTLAAEHAVAQGNSVRVLFEDGKSRPADALSAAQKLLDVDGVDILIVSTTGAAVAVEPLATRRRKNLVAFCMDPDIAARSPFVLRYYEGVEEESTGILAHLVHLPQRTRVGILYAKVAAYEKAVQAILAPRLTSAGLELSFLESYAIGEKQFRPQALKIRAANPTYLIVLGYGFEYRELFNALQEVDARAGLHIVGGWGLLYSDLTASELDGVRVVGPRFAFSVGAHVGLFRSAYRARFGRSPNFDAAFAYDAIRGLAAHVSPRACGAPIRNILANRTDLVGEVGPYRITSGGEMVVEMDVGVFESGEPRILAGHQ